MAIKKPVYITLIVIFSITFLLSASMLVFTIVDREKAISDFNELAEIVKLPNKQQTVDTPLPDEENDITSTPSATVPSQPAKPTITRNIALLNEMNKDCIGWVYIKGTKVNYPVMYTPSSPEKYLKKNFYGEYSGSGVPFVDARCTLESNNIIIYGHNMKNLTMFGGLRKYLDNSYLKNHPIIEFETLEGLQQYKITQVKKTDINDKWFTHNLYAKQDGKSYLTLSTCYGSNKNARLLIIAEKIVTTE